jgi:hypothetical protein
VIAGDQQFELWHELEKVAATLSPPVAAAGNYHRTAPIETFTASANERHPTDLAGLRGAPLITAVETEEGRRWAESKIKAHPSGDRDVVRQFDLWA